MNRPGLRERIAIRLARFVAGPERRHWLDAVEAELDYLPPRLRLDWALGSVVAALKDRAAREWRFGLALGVLPALALVAIIPVSLISVMALKAAGLPPVLSYIGLVLSPLPFAWLLGRIRPAWPPLLVGLAGFLVYQIAPVVAWRIVVGPGASLFWGPAVPVGLPLPVGIPIVVLTWLGGVWWGATAARRAALRKLRPPPSRRS